jgi:hypothetical protein
MGHKGVSKRKPKKTKSSFNNNVNNYSNTRTDDHTPVSALVKDNSAPLNRGGTLNPSSGSNRKQNKGK